ncbi:MAG: metallophosphoesterase [Lachnospiraceae bacterium]|jgi:predicted MPP superfamily phosphohydrolase|nr:metallophosphoesterase [Lachnospiraceae bacterium]
MTFYYLIFRALPAVLAGVCSYFYVRRMLAFWKLDGKRFGTKLLNVVLALVFAALCSNFWSARAMVILHLLAVSLVVDLAAVLLRLALQKGDREEQKKNRLFQMAKVLYRCGLMPVLITGLMLGYGAFNMGRAVRTEYQIETAKELDETYKLVLITDTHYGTIQSKEVLKEKAEEISGEEPDVVVLAGDIVEEDTSKEDMEEVFQVLGSIKSRYGVYYVYGNHDRQPYTNQPTYEDSELADAVRKNGIVILEDQAVELGSDLLLAGRADAAWGNVTGRASPEEILRRADKERFIIMADHQPIEAAENGAAGVDLLISGHTHAGQMWPIGLFSELFGTLNYGEYQEGNCRVIVSSGFTGWGYPFRTEEHCEYVVIEIQ